MVSKARGARRTPTDTYSESRLAWTTVNLLKVVVYLNSNKEEDEWSDSPLGIPESVYFTIHHGHQQRIAVNISLTNLTRPELDAFKQVLDLAFEVAAPIIDAKDAKAKELQSEGNDSIVRLYRTVPEVHVRERFLPKHDPSVQE